MADQKKDRSSFGRMLKRQLLFAAAIVIFGVVFIFVNPASNPFLTEEEPPFRAEASTDLTVVVTGLGGRQGQIILLVYDSEEAFLKAALRQKTIALSGAATLRATFHGLNEGRYAIAAFLDNDRSGSLDTSLMGTLSEQLIFSNGATAPLGAPAFQQASFRLEGEALALLMSFPKAED